MKRSLIYLFTVLPLIFGTYFLEAVDKPAIEQAPSQDEAKTPPKKAPKEESPESKFPFLFENDKASQNEEDKFTDALHNMLITLGLLVVFMFIASWVVKRMIAAKSKQISSSSNIKILDQRQLSSRTILYVIEMEGKTLLIAEGQSGVTLLSDCS